MGDLDILKKSAIELFHLKKIDNSAIFPIPDFCSDKFQVCKVKKFACRSLKGRGVKSGIRITYFFDIQKLEVVFLEMYFKANKENEDRERIREYLKLTKMNT